MNIAAYLFNRLFDIYDYVRNKLTRYCIFIKLICDEFEKLVLDCVVVLLLKIIITLSEIEYCSVLFIEVKYSFKVRKLPLREFYFIDI